MLRNILYIVVLDHENMRHNNITAHSGTLQPDQRFVDSSPWICIFRIFIYEGIEWKWKWNVKLSSVLTLYMNM